MKEIKESEGKNSNEDAMSKNEEKTIEKEKKDQKKRKKPNIHIPIFEINIKYYHIKLNKKNKSKKKENMNNIQNILNISPLKNNPIMIGNKVNNIININTNQNFINYNKQIEEKQEKNFIFQDEEDLKDLKEENNENDDKKSITNQSDISYKNIPVDLDFLSTATSQNGDDIPTKNDFISDDGLKNINLNQKMIDPDIYKQAMEKQLTMMKMRNFNNMNNMNAFNGLNNFGNNFYNQGLRNNMNNYQFMNYLNFVSQMNNYLMILLIHLRFRLFLMVMFYKNIRPR